MSLKKIKNITDKILNEATLDQVVSTANKDKLIKEAIEHNSLSMGDEFYYNMNHEMGDGSAQEILDELGEECPDNMNCSDYLIDNFDVDDYSETKAYQKFIYNEMSYKLESVISDLQYIIRRKSNEGVLSIFRAVNVSDRDNKAKDDKVYNDISSWLNHLQSQGKHLGIYWAESYEKAQEFGYNNVSNFYIIEAEIDNKYVDWYETISLRMDIQIGDESEIRLFKNTPLKIKNIYDNRDDLDVTGETVDISNVENKVFYA